MSSSHSQRRIKPLRSGGGWPAIRYVMRTARQSGGLWKMWRALSSRNACKTCAVGMGGQKGGMVNESGHWPEVCKKSVQAMAADLQGAIRSDFWKTYSLEQLRRFSPRDLEKSGRLVAPMLLPANGRHYCEISWDEALQRIAEKLKQTSPDQTFWYFSGRSSNEAGFLLQLFARVFGTNNVNNCSYYCHQASGVGLASSLGTGTATLRLEDLDQADLVFLIGGNPASNHPRLMTSLMKLRRRGGKVIVINPVRETGLLKFRIPSDVRSLLFGSEIATHYLQPHIGGDLALLSGIAKQIHDIGACDASFLATHCNDMDPLFDHLQSLSWDEIEQASGVSRAEIEEVARVYAASHGTVFSWTMGITHHAHGVENVQAIANLALLRGMVGRPGTGLMPIRGHSNVQGIGTVGVTPKLKDAIFANLERDLEVSLPTQPGLDTLACMEAAAAGKMRCGVCLGGNLYGSNPDAQFASAAMREIDQVIYLNTTLNTGHAHGTGKETVILPVLARDEEPQPTTQESMFNYVRLSDGGPTRLSGPRSEVEIIADLAERVLGNVGPVDWSAFRSTRRIRQAIARAIPGMAKIADIDSTREEFQIEGRTFHTAAFPTPDGRARLFVHELPKPQLTEPSQLRLMTVRSEGQFNTVVYEEEDVYRGQERRDVILIHPDDLARLQLDDDQPVRVTSEIGEMGPVLARRFDAIRVGNALMYYPEANVLVPRVADPQSRTPAFKGIAIRVEPLK